MAKSSRRPVSLRVKLAALAVSLVLALVCAEGLMRLRQLLKYGTLESSVHSFVIDEDSGLRIPRPGLDTGRIRINAEGFRNPDLVRPKPEKTIRLAFLGASTTYCAEVSGNESTWPHLVCEGLRKRYPSARFDYLNAAVPGYGIEHSAKALEARVAAFEPDVIVVYHATNDLSFDTREPARKAGLYEGAPENPSWLAGVSVLWGWIEKNWTVRSRQRAAAAGESRLELDANQLASGFEEELAALLRASRAHAQVVAVATFSWHLREGQSPEKQLEACNTSLFYMPYMSVDGLLAAGRAYNDAIRRAAAESGALLIGDEESIPGDNTHFVDSVHLTDRGCELMADRVLAALEASEAFASLLESANG